MEEKRTIEELQEKETLCEYCEATDYGLLATVHTPSGVITCEGAYCEEAYKSYLEESEV